VRSDVFEVGRSMAKRVDRSVECLSQQEQALSAQQCRICEMARRVRLATSVMA